MAIALAATATFTANTAGQWLFVASKTPISPVLCAILFGAAWRNMIGVDFRLEHGLKWTVNAVLRTGIALVGLRLTLATAGKVGVLAVPVVLSCITVALVASRELSAWLGVKRRLAQLIAVGAAICGCTAVMAVAPIIHARKDEMAYAVAGVVIFGLAGMLCYPWLAHHLFAQLPLAAGIFLGTAIHDTSQVIGAGLIYSQAFDSHLTLVAATTTKLIRNLSMVVLLPWFAYAAAKQPSENSPAAAAPSLLTSVPLFVWAFLGFVFLRALGDATLAHSVQASSWAATMAVCDTASEFMLVSGMAAVGLGIDLKCMQGLGWRPLVVAMLVASLVGMVSLGLTRCLTRWM